MNARISSNVVKLRCNPCKDVWILQTVYAKLFWLYELFWWVLQKTTAPYNLKGETKFTIYSNLNETFP